MLRLNRRSKNKSGKMNNIDIKIAGTEYVANGKGFEIYTQGCNVHCHGCHNPETWNWDDGFKFPTEKIYQKVFEFDKVISRFWVMGGEPSVVKWLYPVLEQYGKKCRFHLNTNAFIKPPSEHVQRLKVSLDSTDSAKWDKIVGKKGAWKRVVCNIKEACSKTVVSITYTLSKKTIDNAVEFAKFCNTEFPGLYAIFFSVYKGTDPEYKISKDDADKFYNNILPELLNELNDESRALILETIDEKRRLMEGVRFEQNSTSGTCFLSMSERVISPDGNMSTCSHLYRDGVMLNAPEKRKECKYGCNRRLVAFNEEVESRL